MSNTAAKSFFTIFFCLMATAYPRAQVTDSIAARIVLDSEVVVAAKRNFDVKRFIEIVRKDTVFEQAFKRLRKTAYHGTNRFAFFSRKGKKKAEYSSKVVQTKEGNCLEMKILEEHASGNYYRRNKQPRYYTSKMFERLFYKRGRHCYPPAGTASATSGNTPARSRHRSKMEKYVAQLKKLIFNPGRKVDVPLIGHKTAIFDEKMIRYYDFYIHAKPYKDGTPCYVFSAKVKSGTPSGKTVIKYLEMWLQKGDWGILAKKYRLQTNNWIFDFDVRLEVDLIETPGGIVPQTIDYAGDWKAPMRRRERGKFQLEFEYP